MAGDLLLADVRLPDGSRRDIRIADGRIAEIGPALAAVGVERLAGAGHLVLPGLVEAHTHLDKTFLGLPWVPHRAGPTISDKVANDRALKRELALDPARQSARQVALTVAAGTTRIRSHVDVDTEIELSHVEGVLETRAAWREAVDIEIVAFPQSGLLIRPGTAELLDRALALGADLLGGLDPSAIDRDPKGHLDTLFALAERHGKGIDIHLHEPGELGGFAIELLLERSAALGMRSMVTVSHAFCLGMADDAYLGRLIDGLAREDVAIVTTAPAGRPAPDPRRLAATGVRVGCGNDGVRDAWSPYGTGDMLERAMLLGMRWNLRRDDEIAAALDLCATAGGRALGAPEHGLAQGAWADLVLVDALSVADAVVRRPTRALVMKRGRIVARDGAVLEELA